MLKDNKGTIKALDLLKHTRDTESEMKAWCSSGLHDTHDVTFLSLLLKYSTTHTFFRTH